MSFDNTGGKIVITQDGRTVLDTSLRNPELIPAATISINSYDIEFPDLWKGVFYRQGETTGPVGSQFTCLTCAAPINQEWGPDRGSPHNLPDIVLGSVPAQCDYIDVFANINRVVAPSPIYGSQPINTFLPMGQEMRLDGGSVIVEWMGPLRRMFSIFLSGNSIVLRRRQSFSLIKDGILTKVRLQASGSVGAGNREYYFEGPNAPFALPPIGGATGPQYFPEASITLGAQIDSKGPDGGSNHRPGGQNPCSMDMSGISYRSVFRVNLRIVPGRVSQ